MKTNRFLPAIVALPLTLSSAIAGVAFTEGGTSVLNEGDQTSVVAATKVSFNDRLITDSSTTYVSGIMTITGLTGASGAGGSTPGNFVNGSASSEYSAPVGNTSNYIAVGGANRPGPLTVTFGTAVSYFGFSWTTPDTYNSVQLFNGSTSLGIFVPETNTPGLTTTSSNGYANFNVTGADVITRAVFTSTNPAFETDNFAFTAVPEPSTVSLMVMALGGLGFVAYRKRAQVA
jgi:hypothetical protein